jgi:hypothetical protein
MTDKTFLYFSNHMNLVNTTFLHSLPLVGFYVFLFEMHTALPDLSVVHCTKNWIVTCSVDFFKACNFYVNNIPYTKKAIFSVCNAISVQLVSFLYSVISMFLTSHKLCIPF